MLLSFFSTIGISLGMGALLLLLRHALHLRRHLSVDIGLTLLGAAFLAILHLVSKDLFGLDEWHGFAFDVAKHGLEMIVILMLLVAF